MKLLIVVALFAIARAELFESLIKNEIDAAVDAIQYTEHSHITLRDLEAEDRELLVREIQTDIAKTLSEKLEATTQKLIDAITNGKQGVLNLFNSFKQLVADLKVAGGNAGDYIKNAVSELKTKINTLNTDHLSPAVKLVVDFIKRFTSSGQAELAAMDTIEDEVVAEVVVRALQRRGIVKDAFKGIVDTGKAIVNKLLTGLHGKFKELGEFLVKVTKTHLENAKPHVENIKTLAKEFLGHAKEATKQTLNEALEFFGAYKGDLGGLWTQLKNSINEVKGHLTTPAPAF